MFMDYTNYIVIIFLRSGHYKMMTFTKAALDAKPLRSIPYNGHLYHFNPSKSHEMHGWFPWMRLNWRNPFMLPVYLGNTFAKRVGLLVYREPDDPLHAVVIPEEPLNITTEIAKRADVVTTPFLFRSIVESPLYKNYQRRLRFGKNTPSRMAFYAVVVIALVVVLLFAFGVVDIPAARG